MKDKVKFRIIGIFSIVILCIGLTYKYLQSDTFYVIKLGNYIVHHGIDSIDHYSWVARLPYTYPHWLYDVFIYYIYHLFGYGGIYVSVIVCFIILVLVIYYISLKLLKNDFLALVISVISVFRLCMFAVARSQIVSIPLFLLEVYFINCLVKNGKNKYIIYLCILSLLVANIHATAWLFYFVLFLPFIGEYIVHLLSNNKKIKSIYHLDKYKNSRIIVEDVKNIKKIFLGMGLSFLMGLLSPSRICYTYVIRIMMGDSQKFLMEHLPLVVIEHPFFLVLILLLIITLVFTKVKVYLREVFMICGLILMCFMSVRHLAFFYTIGFIYIVIFIYRALQAIGDDTFNVLGNMFIHNRFLLLLFVVVICLVSGSQFYKHCKEEYVLKKEYPVKAVEYIKSNLDYKNIRLYNEYNYGSYLIYQDIPVFIDNRCDLYLKEFNHMKYSIFDEMMNMDFKYEKRFKKYQVSHVILNKNNSFYMILLKDSHYNILYEDKYFILFERLG